MIKEQYHSKYPIMAK